MITYGCQYNRCKLARSWTRNHSAMTGCPYTALAIADDAAILAADDNCPLRSPVCLLNKKCLLINDDCKTLLSTLTNELSPTTLTKDLTATALPLVPFYPFAAVGNLANYPNATL